MGISQIREITISNLVVLVKELNSVEESNGWNVVSILLDELFRLAPELNPNRGAETGNATGRKEII